jgi:hypothetical protein
MSSCCRRFFESAKTSVPIPFRDRLTLAALIGQTLDPCVQRIDFIPTAPVDGTDVALGAIIVTRDLGRFRIDIADAGALTPPDDECLRLLAVEALPILRLSKQDIRAEPRASNARLVWSCRHIKVPAGDRIRVLDFLGQACAAPLLEVAAHATSSADPIEAVLSLACAALLDIDLHTKPLCPQTIVSRRPANG